MGDQQQRQRNDEVQMKRVNVKNRHGAQSFASPTARFRDAILRIFIGFRFGFFTRREL